MNFVDIPNANLDRHIYRIMPQDYVFDMFANCENVLVDFHKWKDKFEKFQLKLGGVLDGSPFTYGIINDFFGQCWTNRYLSEAMWGIYANDAEKRFLRIRTTPRKLLEALVKAHPEMPNDTCFLGKVRYMSEKKLQLILQANGILEVSSLSLARSLLLKRRAFIHESELRLLFFGHANPEGIYRYPVDPHSMVTQIMADPNRDRKDWVADRALIKKITGYLGPIKRSKLYDPPEWDPPIFVSKV